MSSGALRSERAAQFLLSPNSSLLKDCSDLMGEALEKKQLVQGLFFDVARLVDRALAFQPDVDSALSGHRGQLTPVNVVIFEQLRDILRDIVQFAKQFRNEAMCRTVIRFPIRVMLCEEIAQLSKRLRSIEVELRVIPTSDAEQRRHEDINDADMTFKACLEKVMRLVHDTGEAAIPEFRQLASDIEQNKYFYEVLVEYMEHRDLSPGEKVLISEATDLLLSDVRRLRRRMIRGTAHEHEPDDFFFAQPSGDEQALVPMPRERIGRLNGFVLMVQFSKFLFALFVLAALNLQFLLESVNDHYLLQE